MQQNKLRTKETYERYQHDRLATNTHAKTLDNPEDIIVIEYTYWKIIQNNYPYDAVSSKHDMLIPKRIFGTLDDATEAERVEYHEIIANINEQGSYDAMQTNFSKNRSIQKHFHVHLLVWQKV